MFEEFPVARKPPPDPALLEFLSARKALKISPDCADAYLRLSQEAAKTPAEALGLLAEGTAAGERAPGPAAQSVRARPLGGGALEWVRARA